MACRQVMTYNLLELEELILVVVLYDDVVARAGCAEITAVALKVEILKDRTYHLRINNQAGLEIDVNALVFLWDIFSRKNRVRCRLVLTRSVNLTGHFS